MKKSKTRKVFALRQPKTGIMIMEDFGEKECRVGILAQTRGLHYNPEDRFELVTRQVTEWKVVKDA